MKFIPFTLGSAALVLLLAPISARADLIPWMYNWSRSPTVINADAPGTGYITLTDERLKSAVGNSDIVATNLKTFSTATPAHPDTFTAKNYTLSLYLFDTASAQSATLSFTGQLSGTLSAQSSILTNTFTGLTTQSVQLGDNLYTATVGPYAPPGVPGSQNSGGIAAHATITVATITSIDTPEPSTIALAGLGLTLLALRRPLACKLRGGA